MVYLVDLVQPKNQTDQIDQTKQINQTDQTNQARAEVPGSKFRKPRTSNSRSFRRPITQNPELRTQNPELITSVPLPLFPSSNNSEPRTQNSELPCPSRSFRRPITQNPEPRTQNFPAPLARRAVIREGQKKSRNPYNGFRLFQKGSSSSSNPSS